MAHLRQQIRENIETVLTGLTTTGSNVFSGRVYPMASSNLPGLVIYTRDESCNYTSIGPQRTIERELTLTVEAYVAATSNIDDSIDTITAEIEVALYADRTRGALADDTRITGFNVDFNADGELPVARCTLDVIIDYTTKEGLPEAVG